MKNLW